MKSFLLKFFLLFITKTERFIVSRFITFYFQQLLIKLCIYSDHLRSSLLIFSAVCLLRCRLFCRYLENNYVFMYVNVINVILKPVALIGFSFFSHSLFFSFFFSCILICAASLSGINKVVLNYLNVSQADDKLLDVCVRLDTVSFSLYLFRNLITWLRF